MRDSSWTRRAWHSGLYTRRVCGDPNKVGLPKSPQRLSTLLGLNYVIGSLRHCQAWTCVPRHVPSRHGTSISSVVWTTIMMGQVLRPVGASRQRAWMRDAVLTIHRLISALTVRLQCDIHGTYGSYDMNFLSIVLDSRPRCRSLTSLRMFETKLAQRLDNDDC